ncbi:hypothetical protein JRO89_XS15G0088900 [Xanthoceras sorbifolium]|uniref:Uncharacterized protein n=1 Tax=Xanthoceras sorbifolium TaxID=99658 RepID=A0ABQ8H1E8_9ROSI|nr:hypothetical protein JRO89_XS15G0088900 [Xanthoceras sorbifolium]
MLRVIRHKSVDIESRVVDLVKRLTLQKKIGFLVKAAGSVSSLGTRFSDVVPGATSFPHLILTAASFNASLFQAIGKLILQFKMIRELIVSLFHVVSNAARAMYNVGLARLTFWSPNINIFRDPGWGSGLKTPGENPLLTSKYAAGYVKGLEQIDDSDPNWLKVGARCLLQTLYSL